MHYICEIALNKQHSIFEERSFQYGYNIDDQKIPRGPFFIKQPTNVVFDGSKQGVTNDVTLRYVQNSKFNNLFFARLILY